MVSVSRRKRFVSAAVLLSQCLMQYFLQNFRCVQEIRFSGFEFSGIVQNSPKELFDFSGMCRK